MKKIYHAHPDVVLVTLAIVILAVLAVCYSWTISSIYEEVHQALTSTVPPSADAFDLSGAAQLDLRGLMNGSSSVPAASVSSSAPATTPAPASTSSSASASTSASVPPPSTAGFIAVPPPATTTGVAGTAAKK